MCVDQLPPNVSRRTILFTLATYQAHGEHQKESFSRQPTFIHLLPQPNSLYYPQEYHGRTTGTSSGGQQDNGPFQAQVEGWVLRLAFEQWKQQRQGQHKWEHK
jgi:hypothetical protein